MQTFLWSFMTYGVLQSGVVVGALILSGFATLERLGNALCRWKFVIGEGRSALTVRIPTLLMFIALCAFAAETWSLKNLRASRAEMMAIGGRMLAMEELRASVVRHQRNWWLSIGSAVCWAIVWRFSSIVTGLREEIKAYERKR